MRKLGNWLALVPVKQGSGGKSRLAAVLDAQARARLAQDMAQHVVATLGACAQVGEIGVVSATRVDWWQGPTWHDRGRGLNAELTACRAIAGVRPLLIVLGDLPLVNATDLAALLDAATEHGVAMATDRAGTGTNALALADGRPFSFRFGQDSRHLHQSQDPAMPVLTLMGLAADLDTREDLAFLFEQGFAVPG